MNSPLWPEPLRPGDPRHVGRYRLEGRLGGGGMGQVFLGRSVGGRPVAVKVVRPELADDPGFRRRFALEIEAARRVGGFYTAHVVDADPEASPPWLVTAYIPGPSLQEAVATHGTLPAEAITVLGAGLAEGLGAIHTCGLVHRDLKPSNVILAADGPRVIDFGITRALDATSHTLSRVVVGTPSFMSPEQARGYEIGRPSDVFSFGLVLAFAATGRSPFGTGPAQAIVYRIVHDEPDLTGLPSHLEELVRRCLAKNPGERASVADILEALADPTRATTQWLPPPIATMITEHRVDTPPGPVAPPPAEPGTRSLTTQDHTGDRLDESPLRPENQATAAPALPESPATPAENLRGPDPRQAPDATPAQPQPIRPQRRGGTATAAATLALLCLLGLLTIVFETTTYLSYLPEITGPDTVTGKTTTANTGLIEANLAAAAVEAIVLAAGSLLLFRHKAAGRWMIAATGGAAALHCWSVSVHYSLTGGPSSPAPLAFFTTWLAVVSAVGAVIASVLPSTGRWCRTSPAVHPEGSARAADSAALRFGPPVALLVLFLLTFNGSFLWEWDTDFAATWWGYPTTYMYFCAPAVLLMLLAALTPRSKGPIRATGHVCAVLVAAEAVALLLMDKYSSPFAPWPFSLAAALAIAVYCYRDTTIRRIRLANPA